MDKNKIGIIVISAFILMMSHRFVGRNITYMVMIMVVLSLKIIIHYKKGVILFRGKKEMMELKR